MENDQHIQYFLGANSANGFVSFFDEFYDPAQDWCAYIIKGGPGTGKSSFMKQVAAALEAKGSVIEYIHCASDPEGLDGLILPLQKVCIMDGTAPHVVEPKFPGVCETLINLGEYWDPDILQQYAQNIKTTTLQNAEYHKRSTRFLEAAAALQGDTYLLALACTDMNKIQNYASRFAHREFKSRGRNGHESKRFLSGITPENLVIHYDTIALLCDKVYVIRDDFGAAGRILCKLISAYAQQYGYDTIVCYCPLFPQEKVEHVLIPDLGIAFTTANRFHQYPHKAYRNLHVQRFMDMTAIAAHKQRIGFNRRASSELIQEGVRLLQEAKRSHDQLEEYYITAMNFPAVEAKAEQVIAEILRRG